MKLKNMEKLLESKTWEPIKGKKNLDICEFTYKANGWSRSRTSKAIPSVKEYVEVEYFDDKDLSIMKAIAIQEEGLDVLLDSKKVFRIAEEYATTGINILKNEIYGEEYGTFIKRLESDLVEEYEIEFNT